MDYGNRFSGGGVGNVCCDQIAALSRQIKILHVLVFLRKSLNKIMEVTVEFLFANLLISSPETSPSSSPR